MKKNCTKNSEFTLRFSSKVNIEDSMLFFFNRMIFLEDQLFIELYNREVEIGNTNEVLQVFYFMTMDRIFNRKFGKSPIVLNKEELLLTVKGKVYLTNTGFELENNKYNLSVKSNLQPNKVNQDKTKKINENKQKLPDKVEDLTPNQRAFLLVMMRNKQNTNK
ncbi:hypothetical protein MG290_07665 [Flavobacterium sp. CBA20B-1]|uniref:hypothetical protein n=1 Tax=unclassified Flavobacterium TaxID=196869 RepID=UPI002224EE26|nr:MULTISPECIES: hypothetical protein [unclassified Flavobacterium]WCM40855.1 hypothetical protein MG290_07665 [Flavobacterium sp. CBA20B-1]